MVFELTIAGLVHELLKPAIKKLEGKIQRPEPTFLKAIELRRVSVLLIRKNKQHWLPEEKEKAWLMLQDIDENTAKIEPAVKLSLRDWWSMSLEEQYDKWTQTNEYYVLVVELNEHVKSVTETIDRALAFDITRVSTGGTGATTTFMLQNYRPSAPLSSNGIPSTPMPIGLQHIVAGEGSSSRILIFVIEAKDWHSSQLPEQVARLVKRSVRDIRRQILVAASTSVAASHSSDNAMHTHQTNQQAHDEHEEHEHGEEQDIADSVSISGSITSDGASASLNVDLDGIELEEDFGDASDQGTDTDDDEDNGSGID